MNRYLYAHGAPTSHIDPTGMKVVCEGSKPCKTPSPYAKRSTKAGQKAAVRSARASAQVVRSTYQALVTVKSSTKQARRRIPAANRPPTVARPNMLRADPGRQVYPSTLRHAAAPNLSQDMGPRWVNWPIVNWSGWEEVGNFAAGWGDAGSFGLTTWARKRVGADDVVDTASPEYSAGEVAGILNWIGLSGGTAAGLRGAPRSSMRFDTKVHPFRVGPRPHLQIDTWKHRVPGSHSSRRFPIPPW
jgi:hypothetical protein